MKKIQNLHEDVSASSLFARESKDGLTLAKDHMAVAGLKTVALYKKRQRYRAIIELLLELKQLFKLRQTTQQAAIDGNFVRAIQSCLKAREVVKTFQAYPSIAKMNDVIREEYSSVKNKLDSALDDCCRSFVASAYERVLGAHYLVSSPHTLCSPFIALDRPKPFALITHPCFFFLFFLLKDHGSSENFRFTFASF